MFSLTHLKKIKSLFKNQLDLWSPALTPRLYFFRFFRYNRNGNNYCQHEQSQFKVAIIIADMFI
ncbi:hypothetical protein FUT83_03745 [Treponema phagedenis]|uniref:Uncharacterized protein n=1 Tax=Treponema phagedenis TaxID=162 RepID=A0AAE6IWQ8_TREPH|nr:hypothetical protein FUT82_01320 [Treponema phagedenis]QEJ99555.1 hypothetical protein FUT82_01830 [Treponema phagedenis]QEJ99564.1 hypothetical protein FUT82_02345 [Treponema phagedenis]QEJ99588.1 hypothetical protein FUT82_05120 [Treponema phagedenis]QEK05138.1 hypothetical protein FUT83_03745 [Treponema phagedenis]